MWKEAISKQPPTLLPRRHRTRCAPRRRMAISRVTTMTMKIRQPRRRRRPLPPIAAQPSWPRGPLPPRIRADRLVMMITTTMTRNGWTMIPQVLLAPKRGRRRRPIPPPRHCRPVPAVVGTSDMCCTASPSWASWLFLWVLGLSLGGTFFLPRLRRRWKVVLVLETWKRPSHSPSQKQSQPMSPSLMRMQPMHQTVI